MNQNIRNLFVFIFVFSVFSLTLQASIISLNKNNKISKIQNQTTQITEEEETHDSDECCAEIVYITHPAITNGNFVTSKVSWHYADNVYFSFTKTIPIPPPKH